MRKVVLVDVEGQKIVLPVSASFIEELSPKPAESWRRAGWKLERTVLLELPYPTRPPGSPIPSLLMSGVSLLLDRGVYVRYVAFSKGYFEGVDELNMEVDVFHETLHVLSNERWVRGEGKPLSEEEIVKREIAFVQRKFGEEGLRRRAKHIAEALRALSGAPAINGLLATLWIWEYFAENFERYRGVAYDIPRELERGTLEGLARAWLYYADIYDALLDEDLRELMPAVSSWALRELEALRR